MVNVLNISNLFNRIFLFFLFLLIPFIIIFKHAVPGAGSIDIETITIDKNPLTINTETIIKGKKLWRKTGCYSCHGGNAEGGVGPSLQDDIWVYKPTDKMLFKTIAKGRSGTVMVAWESEPTENEVWQIIIYLRSIYTGDESKIIW